MRRQATEPIIWEDTQQRLEKFVEQLHEAGVVLVRGGQFRHLMLANTSKGWRCKWCWIGIGNVNQSLNGVRRLGDSPNDWSMLERQMLVF